MLQRIASPVKVPNDLLHRSYRPYAVKPTVPTATFVLPQPPSPHKLFCYASCNPTLKASFSLIPPLAGPKGSADSNGLRPLPPTPTGSCYRSFLSNFLCVPAFASSSNLLFIGFFNAPTETSNEDHAKFLSENVKS